MTDSVSGRSRLAQKLISVKQPVAQAITEETFLDHPELLARYGESGRRHCTADACFHVEFLAGAVEAGSPAAFGDYSRWTARMLGARGIPAHALEENLGRLGKHISQALLPEEIDVIQPFLQAGRQISAAPPLASGGDAAADHLCLAGKIYLAAILSGQRQAALNIVEETLRAGHSLVDIYVTIFADALHRVGELWEMNEVTVAQEHIATSITQYVIAVIYPRMVPGTVPRGSMIVTGVAGELHQIGANLVADAMEESGWAVRFLGTNLPHSSILAAVEENAADTLCISTTIVANLTAVADLVRLVRTRLKQRAPRIVLGGSAYRMASHFARDIGAMDAFTDLRRALDLLCV